MSDLATRYKPGFAPVISDCARMIVCLGSLCMFVSFDLFRIFVCSVYVRMFVCLV